MSHFRNKPGSFSPPAVFSILFPRRGEGAGPGGTLSLQPAAPTCVTDHLSTTGCVTHGRSLASSCSSLDSFWEMGDFLFRQYVIVSWLPAREPRKQPP